MRIQKGILAARDKRMGVLSELIGSVRASPVLGFPTWLNFRRRLSLSNFSLGRTAGSSVHLMPGSLSWDGWWKVQISPIYGFPWISLCFHSSVQLSDVLCPLVLCPHSCFHHFVPRLCPARQRSRRVHCLYGKFSLPRRGFLMPICFWNTRQLHSLAWSGALNDYLSWRLLMDGIGCRLTLFQPTWSSFCR